jgi:ribosomal protein S18 acetylase RimI-like enzyme
MVERPLPDVMIAGPDQADTISTIGRRAFRDAFAHLFHRASELEDYLDFTYDPGKITRSINKENNVFFLSLADDTPVGFMKLKKHSLNPQLSAFAQSELQKIYVLPEYHGLGTGAALLKAGIEMVQGLGTDIFWLDVHISNARAIRFYENYGFRISGRHFFNIGTQTFEYHLMAMPTRPHYKN